VKALCSKTRILTSFLGGGPLQRLNLSGIQAAKRGARFQRVRAATRSSPHIEIEDTTLQLAKDGSTLQVVADAETAAIPLLAITGITIHSSPPQSFSLRLGRAGGDDDNANAAPSVQTADLFIASSADVLNRWVVALTCGVNAFQQQRSEPTSPDSKATELVWQAVRLRIFELAEAKPLAAAIALVTQALPAQELRQSEALRVRLQFLRCEG
jgi:hypothetical protein